MEKFLQSAARYVFKSYGSQLPDVCVVFPNRRAGVFFTAYLQQNLENTVIAPHIKTINELSNGFSAFRQPDRLSLVALLYEIFTRQTHSGETFDDFYFWGETLLSDFDNLDKYLVNANDLFRNITNLKEIEYEFDYLSQPQKEALKRFWGSLGHWEKFKNKEEFLKIWTILEPVYHEFRELLKAENLSYDGMAMRNVAEQIKGGQELDLPFEKYIFVGLNALSECEKILLRYLKNRGKADFLWDYDVAYVDDLKNEAGFFVRENLITFPPPENFIFEADSFSSTKNIEFIAVPSSNGQAQAIPGILASFAGNFSPSFDNTAIVLADESLLFPVLGAIPDNAGTVNVTMGYPVKNSSVAGFIQLLVSLIKNTKQGEEGKISFYYKFVSDILNHQLLAGIETDKARNFLVDIKKRNRVYVGAEELDFSPFHQLLFQIPAEVSGFSSYFLSVLKNLYFRQKELQPENKTLPELAVTLYKAFEKLQQSVEGLSETARSKITPAIYFRLLNQYLGQVSVAFEGEPLSGLQVMGVLETRCLDFENVVIIGLNEDYWPKPSIAPSYIPYNLKKAFGMPLFEHYDAVSAYYFYRLLQRATNVTATYNTVKEGLGSGELSRFGYQLLFDSPHQGRIGEKNFEFRFKNSHVKKLEALSSPEVSSLLAQRFTPEKPLSPTALTMYLSCRYKFYLRYIAGLPDKDEVREEVDGQAFGKIFHALVEEIYRPDGKGILTSEYLRNLAGDKIKLARLIKKAFAKEFYLLPEADPGDFKIEGSPRLAYEYIRSYLLQLLKVDMQISPFEIISVEKMYSGQIEVPVGNRILAVSVGGIIDRLDQLGGHMRVIDYKTGRVDDSALRFDSVEALFDPKQKAIKKEAFQALFYSLVLRKFFYREATIKPGIYALRKLFGDKFSPYFLFAGKELEFGSLAGEFEDRLVNLVQEIFSPQNVFIQTDQPIRCSNCPYRIICHRN